MFGSRADVRVGRFRIEKKVAEGGMGVVYAARDPEIDRRVAVKLLHVVGDGAGEMSREARALGRLSHPNVVSIHDIGEVEGRMYIAMEYVEGPTLREWGAERTWSEIVEAYLQAGAGLAAAHDVGIVHRDFKPDNAIVGADGRVRVVDFGLAQSAGREELEALGDVPLLASGLTVSGRVRGTPAYMAPEQVLGDVGPASDQFAFCVALYEALAGRRPFQGTSFAAVVAAARGGNVQAPPGGPTPAAIWQVVRKGLAPTPEERFESMHALLAALREVGKPAGRRRLVPWVVGVALTLGGAAFLQRDASRETEPVVTGDAGAQPDVGTREHDDPILPPGTCPGFRAPGIEAEVRDGRRRFLESRLVKLSDDDPTLPETLLWVAEFELQAGNRTAACGALRRIAGLESPSEHVATAACWSAGLCRAAPVTCPTGTYAPTEQGCEPQEQCAIDLDGDVAQQLTGACEGGSVGCCQREAMLAQLYVSRAQKSGDDERLAEHAAEMMRLNDTACERGVAASCVYLSKLLTDGDPSVPDDPGQAQRARATACSLGHVASCD